MASFFGKRKVCGVDTSRPQDPVYVCAVWEGRKIAFHTVKRIPEECHAACALPSSVSLVRRIESPFASLSKTRKVLPSLLDIQMPFSLEDCFVAFTHLNQGSNGKLQALAAAARKTALEHYLEESKASGVDPAFVDVEGLALWDGALIENGTPRSEESTAVVRLDGPSRTLVLGRGKAILSSHVLSSLDTGHVKRLLAAAYGSATPVEWRLCGHTADDWHPVMAALGPEWNRSSVELDKPGEFLARSLARRAAQPGPNAVNLRQESLTHPTLASEDEHRAKGLAALLALCGIGLAALSLGANFAVDAKARAIESRFMKQATELAGGNLRGAAGADALRKAEKAVAKKLEQARPLLAPFEPSLQLLVREIAAAALKHELLIETLNISRDEISVTGTASAWKDPETLRDYLQGAGRMVSLERTESLADESVRFTISSTELETKR